MRKQKIYLETTVFNYYFDSERDAHAATIKLFQEIKEGKHEAYTSSYVVDELSLAPEPKKTNMIHLINKYGIMMLNPSESAEELAETYVSEGIIPQKYMSDARHIASATYYGLNSIISLNFQHINRIKTKTFVPLINKKAGYADIVIYTPMEVIEND